jgi:DsbC/DsbD-like thiol-disulfide interchange protein
MQVNLRGPAPELTRTPANSGLSSGRRVGYDEDVTRIRAATVVLITVILASSGFAQARRPTAQLTPIVATKTMRAGGTARLVLRVALPKGFHVQADKPRDPALVATVLTVTPPKGTSVATITYPKPVDLKQAGVPQPLAVFEEAFEITVQLKVQPSAAPGRLTVPATLRYQACNDSICFIPTRADTSWPMEITRG